VTPVDKAEARWADDGGAAPAVSKTPAEAVGSAPDENGESADERRNRESAREVAEWETAFAAAKEQGALAGPPDADRANAGAMVSRAHRAEKSSGGSPNAARPDDWAAGPAE
jgi:hypothetical protein